MEILYVPLHLEQINTYQWSIYSPYKVAFHVNWWNKSLKLNVIASRYEFEQKTLLNQYKNVKNLVSRTNNEIKDHTEIKVNAETLIKLKVIED